MKKILNISILGTIFILAINVVLIMVLAFTSKIDNISTVLVTPIMILLLYWGILGTIVFIKKHKEIIKEIKDFINN